jgi:superfamily I DNA and/or RNA helicase
MEVMKSNLSVVALEVTKTMAVARRDFHQARIRAKAKAYENKSVIGGTIVGCISRLDSIRRTRPFAVLVEEASEVLEPLLFACLSESTVKLELVGDHRQLQPSMMNRFDFEIMNKVNVSLFQRLIEAPDDHAIPSTVLSIQRRMRKNICDLTRDFYTDIVKIEDDSTCGTQVIGKRHSQGASSVVRSTATGGREIPGVGPHVYLWTHNGTQSRSTVGVSRINQHEANLACALAAYLVECGVPKPSIVVLTPYKGQLMLMRNMFLTDSRFRSYNLLTRNPTDVNVCRLSTIDRFQGAKRMS